jgi:aerobic carbon-monoxide dehydrogenase large subunit
MDYAVPMARAFPQFTTTQTETLTRFNPLGAKGIGELATVSAPPAVVNAVLDALAPFGIRHLDMPLHAERIWRAIQDARAERDPVSRTPSRGNNRRG